MEQKKSKKSGIFNALKKRFWTGNISGKSCFKKKGSKLKLRTESTHCVCNPCGNYDDDISVKTLGNNPTCERTQSIRNSESEPFNGSDIQVSSANSEVNVDGMTDSAIVEEQRQINPGRKLEDHANYVGPRSNEQPLPQESSTNTITNSPCCAAAQSNLQIVLSESQCLVGNEAFSEGNAVENQNQLETNLKSGLLDELLKLSKCGWYWGNISKKEAEEKLTDQPDGAFLLRDSSADHFLLSLSFRSSGKTLHTRIVYSLGLGLFSFYQQPDESFSSIADLIEHSMFFSKSAVYCYSRPRSPGHPAFPVRLTKPVSRFAQVRSLQHLCRFVIRESIRLDNIQKLPLPPSIKGYIEEGHY